MRQDDAALIDAWGAGDGRAGDALFRRHFAAVFRFFYLKLGPDAEDLTQRTFLACLQNRERVHGSSFRAYLFGVARNQLLMHLRARGRKKAQEDLEQEVIVADGAAHPQGVAVRHQEQELILRSLAELPLGQRMALELFYWEGLSVVEIAQSLDLSPSAVKNRLARGRERLRTEITKLASSEELLRSTLGSLDRWTRDAGRLGL